ncbi:MAG: cell division related protein [uncultured bacterium]|nr:MAG: cell division related protein [uncultured bacterium]OGT27901.1 MAG: hypothetical protein A2624_07220 [Gammaproteobacteria bacterium RIFCSPHIGHO2_01_FULL_42_8]OGT50804.1 MAG: hypothetical protein A3E54_00990 [Gammaproteobacteria bacterium RIFCSPHIGHO2_12_FULL_41_25]OGT61787.1 MAG: hypothetical protein A3I77_00710 [Gammaproteobacteria bacterium RIFCSPLOWO2_02_FULL_42_14]OGT85532.1 MAG: hypothetical protein A3G86_06900 [Gammaproteobacteria bacterium RIFCSPLOWO2_12_FULL_42_18]
MEEKTKQRITGVLVFVGVLFVILPFLFHRTQPTASDQKLATQIPTTPPTAQPVALNLPVIKAEADISPSIPSSSSPSTTPLAPALDTTQTSPSEPASSATTTTMEQTSPSMPPVPTTATTPSPTSEPTTSAVTAPQTPPMPPAPAAATAVTAPQVVPQTTPTIVPTTPATPSTPATPVQSNTSSAASAHHTASHKLHNSANAWTIQLGAFSSQKNAHAMVAELRKHHFEAYTKSVRHGKEHLIAVYVGPEINKHRLAMTETKLKNQLRLHGVIRKYEV